MSGVRIAPGHIVSGLGSLERAQLGELLALVEDTDLATVLGDRAADLRQHLPGGSPDADAGATAAQRFAQRAAAWTDSRQPDAALRLQLWTSLRDSLDLEPAVPFSTRAADRAAVDMAHASARTLAGSLEDLATDPERGRLARMAEASWNRVTALVGGAGAGPPDFTRIAQAQAARLLAEAARQGTLDAADQAALAERIRDRLAALPVTERDASIEQALRGGDRAALSLVASGTSLLGVGVAVDLAGFGAYILAAQAAGIVPLLGGKVAVSTLAVLANPVFAVGALLGGGYIANRHMRTSLRRQIAAGIAVLLALNGLSAGRNGQRICVEDLRHPDAAAGVDADTAARAGLERKRRRVSDILGEAPPPAPGAPPETAARMPPERTADAITHTLFRGDADTAREVLVVGGLTVGDMLADAAAIHPHVVNAADFARQQDLDGLLAFGAFADRAGALSGAAATGTHAQLQGYVAEQLVATRLVEQGHQVAFPDRAAQPGYDILVDGMPFQIKCADDTGILAEHFAAYPDVPVIANAELAEATAGSAAAWADRVFAVEGFDQRLTRQIVDSSLAAGADLDDLPVPVFALGVGAARHLHAWWRGTVPLSDLPFEIALDGAVKGSLALAGTTAAKATGLVLLGPAGGLILGSAGGTSALFAGPALRQWADRQLWHAWHAEVEAATVAFETALRDALHRKLAILHDKAGAIAVGASAEKAWIKQRLYDDAVAIAEGLAALDDIPAVSSAPERARAALQLMTRTGTHPWTVQAALTRLCETLREKPSLSQMTRDATSETLSGLQQAWHGWRRP